MGHHCPIPAVPAVLGGPCLKAQLSTLALLMLRVVTDHHDFSLALNDFALLTNLFDRRSDFHLCALLISEVVVSFTLNAM